MHLCGKTHFNKEPASKYVGHLNLSGVTEFMLNPQHLYKSDGNGFRLHGWQCSKTVKAPALEDKQNLFQQ